jgi:hypothetical protein
VTSNVISVREDKQEKMWRSIYKVKNQLFFDDFSFLIADAGEQWDKIYKKSFLDKYNIRCYEQRLWFEDIWFSSLVAINAKSIAVDRESTYFYRIREGSLSEFWDVREQYLWHGLDMYKKILEHVNLFAVSEDKRMDLMVKLRDKIYWFVQVFYDVYSKDEKIKNKVGQYYSEFEKLVYNKTM